MGNAFLYGNGGGSLNFKVIGGTTQPTGSENLIWVNTSDVISDWVFSRDEPTGVEGRVWFSVHMSSNTAFNAVKKNGIWVYPSKCRQFVSGAWVNKTAKTYQSGAWVDWDIYAFNNGDTCGVTWGYSDNSGGYGSMAIADQIIINIPAGTYGIYYASAWSETAFDLTRFNTLRFDVERQGAATVSGWQYIVGAVATGGSASYAAQTSFTSAGRSVIDVNISSLAGNYYPSVRPVGSAVQVANVFKIYSVQLIP